MEEIFYASAVSLAARIRARELSSREVVEAYLARIEQVNPDLNAMVQLAADQARPEAAQADAALARGRLHGPLHGVPFTVKDWIEAAGLVCAAGEPSRATYVPAEDATVVTRMRQAGA